jgi:ankyrin repeat protein
MLHCYASADAIEVVIKAMGGLSPQRAQSALLIAARNDQEKAVAMLLRHGADPNKPGSWEGPGGPMLPLLACTISGAAKAAKVLLENGADPNAGEKPGRLLENAVQNGHRELAKLLRAAGTKGVSDLAFFVSIRDEAEVGKLLETAPAFAEQPAFWSKALSSAARNGDLRVVRAALEKGVPIATGPGDDAIAEAAFEGQYEAIVELLKHRPASASPDDLRHALRNAIWNSCPYEKQRPAEAFERSVKALLDAGAPVTPLDGHRSLVSTAVFTRNPGGNPKVVELLVAAGADPNPETAPGNPRLSDAIQDACKRGFAPSASTIEMFEKLAKVTIQR